MGKTVSIIPDSVRIYGEVDFGEKCILGEYSIIGYPYVESEKSFKTKGSRTIIGNKCIIGAYVIIYNGTKIGDRTSIEDYCRIGDHVKIGKNCRILYGAKIYDNSVVEDNSIIAGFCCDRAEIGKNVRLFGELIHPHREPHLGWDDIIEKSPVIEDHVFIGFGAKIIGGIKIGRNSYITSGAIVTKHVVPKSIVYGIDEIIPYSRWKGKLRKSEFFRGKK